VNSHVSAPGRAAPGGGEGASSSSSPSAGRRVEVLRDLAAIEALRSQWQAMDPAPDAGPDAYATVLRARAGTSAPLVVALRDGDRLDALLVARDEPVEVSCRFGSRTLLRARPRGVVVLAGGALRRAPDVPWTPLVGALRGLLREGGARVVCVRKIAVDSDLRRELRSAAGGPWRSEADVPELRWRLALPASMDELMQRVNRHGRQKLRRYKKTLERDFPGKVVLRRTKDPADVPAFCVRAEAVARDSYQRGLGAGFVHDAEREERLTQAARAGRLRAFDLEVDGAPRAFWITERSGEALYVDSTAFDRGFSKFEPGTVVLLELLADAIGEGVRVVDYGFGDALYKRRFDAQSTLEADVYLFAPGLRGLCLGAARGAIASLHRTADAVVTRLGVKDRLRKSMRDRARRQAEEDAADGEKSGGEEESS
jgi:CelD/BcsL family acetyltransferase involved in cellulose biosynthesis